MTTLLTAIALAFVAVTALTILALLWPTRPR